MLFLSLEKRNQKQIKNKKCIELYVCWLTIPEHEAYLGMWLISQYHSAEENGVSHTSKLFIENSFWFMGGTLCASPSPHWDFVWLELMRVLHI